MATMTSSKRPAARAMTSRWPLWMGSKDPGHTVRLMLRTYLMERPGYHDWMHRARELSTPLAPAPWQRTALGANLLAPDGSTTRSASAQGEPSRPPWAAPHRPPPRPPPPPRPAPPAPRAPPPTGRPPRPTTRQQPTGAPPPPRGPEEKGRGGTPRRSA